MDIKPITEFLLWDNCNNNCEFCFQRKNPRLFASKGQEKILENVKSFINSEQYIKGSHVLVVGGELFDTNREYMLPFFEFIINKMLSNDIDILYLNTNLIFDKTYYSMLKPVLDLFDKNNLFDRLKFTTSFDLAGRFKTSEAKSKMLTNLLRLKDDYENLKTVVNIILTKQFCESVISERFDIFDFMRSFKVNTNLIPYIVLKEDLCGTRNEIFTALLKINEQNPEYIRQYVANMDLRHKRYLYACYPDNLKLCSCDDSECGHSVNFKKYSLDSNNCFVCDLKKVFDA